MTAIETAQSAYKIALKKRYLAPQTIERYSLDLARFLNYLPFDWDAKKRIDSQHIIDYIQYLKSQNYSPNRINTYLNSLRQYFSLVVKTYNPVGALHLQNRRANVLEQVLDYPELEALYFQYKALEDRMLRNKIMLGLLVYQALSTADLHALKIQHLDLQKGQIYLPISRRLNARTLDLASIQMIDLQYYMQTVRPRMLANLTAEQAGRKTAIIQPQVQQQLFFSRSGSLLLKNSLTHLFIALKKQQSKLVSAKQIRASTLAHWLRTQDLRTVQYKAGHRYVSSTEKYDLYRYEVLKTSLQTFHPLANF